MSNSRKQKQKRQRDQKAKKARHLSKKKGNKKKADRNKALNQRQLDDALYRREIWWQSLGLWDRLEYWFGRVTGQLTWWGRRKGERIEAE